MLLRNSFPEFLDTAHNKCQVPMSTQSIYLERENVGMLQCESPMALPVCACARFVSVPFGSAAIWSQISPSQLHSCDSIFASCQKRVKDLKAIFTVCCTCASGLRLETSIGLATPIQMRRPNRGHPLGYEHRAVTPPSATCTPNSS